MTLRLLVFRDRLVGIDPSLFCSYFALHSVFGFSGRSLIFEGAKYSKHKFLHPCVPRPSPGSS